MRTALIRYSPLLILAIAWQLIAHFELVSSTALPPLTQIGGAWLDLLRSGDLLKNAAPSLYRAGAGLMLAVVAGAALGTTTSHIMRSRPAPMQRADQTSTCSVERAPL